MSKASLKYCTKDTDIEFLKKFIKKYYLKLSDLTYRGDVDVITHLTFPFRYVNGYANIRLDVELFYKEIGFSHGSYYVKRKRQEYIL